MHISADIAQNGIETRLCVGQARMFQTYYRTEDQIMQDSCLLLRVRKCLFIRVQDPSQHFDSKPSSFLSY